MARPGKIDKTKLAKLIREGKGTTECAKIFGVSLSAISIAKRAIRQKGARNMATTKQVERAVTQGMNAVDQMQKINNAANEMLDLCIATMNGDLDATAKLSDRIEERDGKQVGIVFKLKDPRELALKAMAEVRKQIELQQKIYDMLYDHAAVKDFQEVVIEVMSEYDTDARRKILDKLQARRAIRSVTGFSR